MLSQVSHGVAFGTIGFENLTSEGGVARRRNLFQHIGHGLFSIAVFLVSDPFGGTSPNLRRAIAQQYAPLFQIKVQFAHGYFSAFDRIQQNWMKTDSLQEQVNRRDPQAGREDMPALDQLPRDGGVIDFLKDLQRGLLDGGHLAGIKQGK